MNDDVMSGAAYYRSRESEERASADQAPSEVVRNIHIELAERYAQLAVEYSLQQSTDT